MIKALIICTLFVFASCDGWLGNWQVSSATPVNYNQCDLPPVSSVVTIQSATADTMTFTRLSSLFGTNITQPLGWPSSQTSGVACYSTYGYCITGTLGSNNATLYWYPTGSQSTGCQLVLTPITPPAPTWIGSWGVSESQPAYACPVPLVGSQVTIAANGAFMVMTGTDSQSSQQETWNLNWTPTNVQAGPICANFVCTSGNLTSTNGVLTGTVTWVKDQLYLCNAVITRNQDDSYDVAEDLFLGF